ncbi:Multifunctional CCA protein [Serratia symbiotica]|nr:Multifunctional CCA protein [Serratia symbiotica]
MKIYLVGGAVRDELLNIPIFDRDWVIVGAKPENLLKIGYQKVGKDFPVFLHPDTHEEYALARTERKSGSGYTNFICYTTPNITLEEDLLRRDLTINAIARSSNGVLIDPYKGIIDLNKRILRHISHAFIEDPLRVLRVARFAAKFSYLGFRISKDTMKLMSYISQSGELTTITAERCWKETEKALLSQHPQIYFKVLQECGALKILFPEINSNRIHTMMTLTLASKLSSLIEVRFSALCYDIKIGLLPKKYNKNYYEPDLIYLKLIETFCKKWKIPNLIRDLSILVAKYSHLIYNIHKLQPNIIIQLFDKLDVWRKPERLEKIILSSEINFQILTKFKDNLYLQSKYLRKAYQIAFSVSIKKIIALGLKGQDIRNELTLQRQKALIKWKNNNKNNFNKK